MKQLTLGSLFSGIGGFELGFEWTGGYDLRWQVEIDPWCRKVLTKHWPSVPKYEDVREVGAHNLEPVDVIVGGFPCQDISNAGKGAGIHGERSGLWSEFHRTIRELRPRYAVMENVSALLHRGLDVVLRDLASCGYDAEWDCIPASALGAPHRRDRIWMVAYPTSKRAEPVQQSGQRNGTITRCSILAHASSERLATLRDARGLPTSEGGGAPAGIERGSGTQMAHSTSAGREARGPYSMGARQSLAELRATYGGKWATEPGVGGSPDGFPYWLERHIGRGMSYEESRRAIETLRGVWNADVAQAVQRAIGGLGRVQAADVLFAFMREYQADGWLSWPELAGTEAFEEELRGVRLRLLPGSAPQGQEPTEQQREQRSDPLPDLSRQTASWDTWEGGVDRVASGVPRRVDRLRGLGNAVVPQVAQYVAECVLSHYRSIEEQTA